MKKGFRSLNEVEKIDDDPDGGPREHWGYHLLVDMSGCNKKINDAKYVTRFFNELIQKLNMKKLTPIYIRKVDEEWNRGLSAVQMITTSSITFHGDDINWAVYLDVFSCKPFEPKVALNLAKIFFTPTRLSKKFIYRDAGPAKNIDKEQSIDT